MSTVKFKLGEKLEVEVVKGDITEIACDAIVNPANSLMIMGGGVAGAIKRKGGGEIEKEALKHAPVPVGEAIVTGAGKLRARYVIHAPTMERPAMPTTFEKVKKAASAALRKTIDLAIKCVAFPALGAGVGGLDPSLSVRAVIEAAREMLVDLERANVEKIILVAYSDEAYQSFLLELRRSVKGG